ncbi:MAG: 50S ribosomal protein L13 [Chloroflexi bacterium]|nr:50S ribosomal protein L13 [Chloroflexota bacterium]
MKTYAVKLGDIKRNWLVVDAEGQTLGRFASRVAGLLRGKHKPIFSPHLDVGDYVIVVNAAKVRVTGEKLTQKQYYRHSGYPGGLKTELLRDVLAKRPERVIEHAVKGMLPHNALGHQLLRKLKVYAGPTHPHAAQQPVELVLE